MIMVISMRNAFLVPIIFTILPSLHPPSFHEMIFILVYSKSEEGEETKVSKDKPPPGPKKETAPGE